MVAFRHSEAPFTAGAHFAVQAAAPPAAKAAGIRSTGDGLQNGRQFANPRKMELVPVIALVMPAPAALQDFPGSVTNACEVLTFLKQPNSFSASLRHQVSLWLVIPLSCLVLLSTANGQQASPTGEPVSQQPAPAMPEQSAPAKGSSDYAKEAFVIESMSSRVSFENDG